MRHGKYSLSDEDESVIKHKIENGVKHGVKWIFYLIVILGFVLLGGLVFQLLWNAVAPVAFNGGLLSYWQAVALLLMARLLFGQHFGSGKHSRPGKRRSAYSNHEWKEHLKKRCQQHKSQTAWSTESSSTREAGPATKARPKLLRGQISRIQHEFADTWSYYIKASRAEGSSASRFPSFIPGQYVHLAAPTGEANKDLDKDLVRHMSIASSPSDKELLFSMDLSSDSLYKQSFRNAKPGDELRFFKIKGDFTLENIPAGSKIVFIAGGIGVTPIRSLIRQLEEGPPAVPQDLTWDLVYVARAYLYRSEFESYSGKQSYIGRAEIPMLLEEKLKEAGPAGLGKTAFFLSGSNSFVSDITELLLRLGISQEQIHVEDFH